MTRPTSRPSSKSVAKDHSTGVDRLYVRKGVRRVTFWYKYADGRRETLSTAPVGDRAAIAAAELSAKRKAIDIQAGQVVAGSVGELIDRFASEVAPTHFADQSANGRGVRAGTYRNLTKFFGRMAPAALRKIHGYQYLDARAKSGAPVLANKELAMMSTICSYAERWGIIEANPFVGMRLNKADKKVRTIDRSQVVKFYLWALRQDQPFRTMGCAAMFCYLTGFRAAEVRPFHMAGVSGMGVQVVSAKRKKGEEEVSKLRTWSPRLRTVVARAKQGRKVSSLFLFANRRGQPYSKSGWGAVWSDAMYAWIAGGDPEVGLRLAAQKAREADQRRGFAAAPSPAPSLAEHPLYFALSDIRPAAITRKIAERAADAYDFAAHANPATTHRHYDRRRVKSAAATE
ncbi:site-specific integrase [Chitinasiproducens palmae]|uniref:Site-specific recombinase XerD n=1 Tax=Chitinasiproducens palmae TaxID=1770053 RepID=A0A1H2PS74_9BURK|nr:hypothetical protein [Chitinasiproducens palmae]SDV49772.1 Site-specific recombinase XerD [Chitinasiproducens palmae]